MHCSVFHWWDGVHRDPVLVLGGTLNGHVHKTGVKIEVVVKAACVTFYITGPFVLS